MPRQARIQSESGVYHVMMRGINHQRIFEDEEDCYHFLQCLRNAQEQYDPDGKRLPDLCTYYAYALMPNHIHILVHSKGEAIGDTVKRIASSYVYYFNRKYGRDGHLFKERFKSEPCDSWNYFVTLLRYIHQNPVKAGLVDKVADYEFTSWSEYNNAEFFFPLCNVRTVLNRITHKELSDLVNTLLDDTVSCVDYEEENISRPTDDQLLLYLKEKYELSDGYSLQRMEKERRNIAILALLQFGAQVRQIQRLTGVGRNIIGRLARTI